MTAATKISVKSRFRNYIALLSTTYINSGVYENHGNHANNY